MTPEPRLLSEEEVEEDRIFFEGHPIIGTSGTRVLRYIADRRARIAQVADLQAEASEIERKYRLDLWANHGHPFAALYGDDGEMQCSACPCDFKRSPLIDCEHQRLIVRSRLPDLQTEVERYRSALAYYAEPRNMHPDHLRGNDSYDAAARPGARARAALAQTALEQEGTK